MFYTYKQLLGALNELSPEELEMNVAIYDRSNDIYHTLAYTGKCEGDDTLDDSHPIMIINDFEE